jgi:hypothetical protein
LNHKLYILLIIIICSCLQVHFTYAQNFKVNLSPKHLAKINEGKSAHEKLKKYRKFFSKDSAKQMKKLNKQLQRKYDSSTRVMLKEQKLTQLMEKKGIKPPIDTLEVLKQYASLIRKDTSSWDSLRSKGLTEAESKALEALPANQKGELQTLHDQYGLSKDELKKILAGDSTTKKEIKAKLATLSKDKGMENLSQMKQVKELQSTYGFSINEAQGYLSGDSTAKKKIKIQALQKAKEKSLASLPPGQRKQVEAFQKEYGPYSKEIKQYLFFLKDSVDRSDTLKAMIAKNAKELATKFGGSEIAQVNAFDKKMAEMKAMPDQYKKQVDQYKDPAKVKEEAKQKAAEQLSQLEAVKGVQNKMGLAKKKFSTLLNSNDLSTGIKEKSLKGRPLRERWVIGGNFNIANTSPLMIDLSPQFGYKINKKFQVGVSGIYRAKFVDSVRVSNAVPADVRGYSAFATYGLMLNFFAYAEFERTSSTVKQQSLDPKGSVQWVNSALVGIGRQFRLHSKVNASVLLLWNPLHENGKSPYHDAFVIKTGFQLSDLALLKR